MKHLVFLGGGRITTALISGLRLSGYSGPITVLDRHSAKLRRLEKEFRAIPATDLRPAVQAAKTLIVAVRPDSVADLLGAIGPVNRRMTAISLAAGIPLKRLNHILPAPVRWARAMPSPVSRVGRGLTALAFDPKMRAPDRKHVRGLFARMGEVIEIPEKTYDVFTVTYSSSHGYHALATLAAAAQKLGLDRKSAMIAASHALADGIVSLREGRTSLDGLLHEAATPGGIAATVMQAMDKAGYARAVSSGLRAGLEKARKHAQ